VEPLEIEFLTPSGVPVGEAEDVLDVGRPPRHSRLGAATARRRVVTVVAAAVVAAVAGSIVAIANHGSDHKSPVAVPSVQLLPPVRAPEGFSETHRTIPTGVPVQVVPSTRQDPCDATQTCLASSQVPAGLGDAIREYLPAAQDPTVSSRFVATPGGDETLSSRVIETHIGPVDLVVRLSRYQHSTSTPPTAFKAAPKGQASEFFEVEGPGYVVDAEWIAAPTQQAPDVINDLIRDPRLQALT
jgi:hypothetical protein